MIYFSLIAITFNIGSIIGNYDLSCCLSNNIDNNIASQLVYNDTNNTISYNDICILKYYTDDFTLFNALVGVEYSHVGNTSFIVDSSYDINDLTLITFIYDDVSYEHLESYVNISYNLSIEFQFGATSSRLQSLDLSYVYRAYYDNYNYESYDDFPTYPYFTKYSINVSNTDYLIGYNDGFTDGYDRGYYEGSNDLRDVWNGDFVGWLGSAVGGFFSFEIFPGFTLGGAIGAVIAAYLMVWLLRVFAGG